MTAFEDCAEALAREPRTWVVTGAAGFIGSHLTLALLRLGQRVVGLDNFSSGTRENLALVERELAAPEKWAGFRMVEGDVCDFDRCVEVLQAADVVLHQAAIGSVPRSIERPLDTHRANVNGTLNVFLAALETRVPRVVYASSSSVYGDEPTLPKVEARIGEPLSPYALSKRIDEMYAAVLGRTHGLRSIGLRYFNVVGARQSPTGPYAAVIPRWAESLARGQRPVIFGDGETSRDFCPVSNVVQANVLAAMAPAELAGRVYNVALGERTTLKQLFVLMRDGMAARGCPCADLQPEHQAFRPGDVQHSLANIDAARSELGYAPDQDLRSGLQEVMDSFARGPDDGRRSSS